MPRYTTKGRAKRIDLGYFKRLHRFRRWKLILTIAVPAAAAAWIVAATMRGDPRLYTSGPVSPAHAMFGLECRRCHRPEGAQAIPGSVAAESSTTPATGFRLRASDEACLSCHDGPAHNANQTFTPRCATCHVEHKGRVELASMRDRNCTQCHGDMQLKPGTRATFATIIRSFPTEHPEFAIAIKDGDRARRMRLDHPEGLKDTAQIKLNHEVHLKPGLRGVDELPAGPGTRGIAKTPAGGQLGCAYCHQPDETQAYMAPVRFARHCVACHALDFDMRVPSAVVPHDTPKIVRAFLRDFFTTAVEECRAVASTPAAADDGVRRRCQALALAKGRDDLAEQPRGRAPSNDAAADVPRGRLSRRGDDEAEKADRPKGRLGGRQDPGSGDRPSDRPVPQTEGVAPGAWVASQLESAETVFKEKCAFCHTVHIAPRGLAEVTATAIPARWLPHSRFDHRPHRVLGCVECHQAARSTETKDVLLPSIKTCSECHQGSDGARASCVECHRYHDKALERDTNGPFAVRDLRPRRSDSGRTPP